MFQTLCSLAFLWVVGKASPSSEEEGVYLTTLAKRFGVEVSGAADELSSMTWDDFMTQRKSPAVLYKESFKKQLKELNTQEDEWSKPVESRSGSEYEQFGFDYNANGPSVNYHSQERYFNYKPQVPRQQNSFDYRTGEIFRASSSRKKRSVPEATFYRKPGKLTRRGLHQFANLANKICQNVERGSWTRQQKERCMNIRNILSDLEVVERRERHQGRVPYWRRRRKRSVPEGKFLRRKLKLETRVHSNHPRPRRSAIEAGNRTQEDVVDMIIAKKSPLNVTMAPAAVEKSLDAIKSKFHVPEAYDENGDKFAPDLAQIEKTVKYLQRQQELMKQGPYQPLGSPSISTNENSLIYHPLPPHHFQQHSAGELVQQPVSKFLNSKVHPEHLTRFEKHNPNRNVPAAEDPPHSTIIELVKGVTPGGAVAGETTPKAILNSETSNSYVFIPIFTAITVALALVLIIYGFFYYQRQKQLTSTRQKEESRLNSAAVSRMTPSLPSQ